MSDLFNHNVIMDKRNEPLAARMRPLTIDKVIGQKHLLGKNAPLSRFFEQRRFPSIIFWGPPGVGKTTLAQIIAEAGDYYFVRLSAVESGVKEVRAVLANAEKLKLRGTKSLLFIDEIHRFNKNQQDALLHAVEKGLITLIGATTENPSFEVNSASLSRTQVYRLQLLTEEEINLLLDTVLKEDEILSKYDIQISPEDRAFIYTLCGGDARSALNALDLCFNMYEIGEDTFHVTREMLENALQQKTAKYDKSGESHYDTISAFIKSMRGSDPDAAILWLAKMLDAGEDAKFIARRMVIFASEDVGNADPLALVVAINVFKAVEVIGMPEARINLAQGVTYLASAPKSNASYMAINQALDDVKNGIGQSVPLHLRNAPTKLMKNEGYGKGYKYPHDYDKHFVKENYFPIDVPPKPYYQPSELGREKAIKEKLQSIWSERYE